MKGMQLGKNVLCMAHFAATVPGTASCTSWQDSGRRSAALLLAWTPQPQSFSMVSRPFPSAFPGLVPGGTSAPSRSDKLHGNVGEGNQVMLTDATDAHMPTHAHARTHTHARAHRHTHTHTHTHIHIHTHTHTHTHLAVKPNE